MKSFLKLAIVLLLSELMLFSSQFNDNTIEIAFSLEIDKEKKIYVAGFFTVYLDVKKYTLVRGSFIDRIDFKLLTYKSIDGKESIYFHKEQIKELNLIVEFLQVGEEKQEKPAQNAVLATKSEDEAQTGTTASFQSKYIKYPNRISFDKYEEEMYLSYISLNNHQDYKTSENEKSKASYYFGVKQFDTSIYYISYKNRERENNIKTVLRKRFIKGINEVNQKEQESNETAYKLCINLFDIVPEFKGNPQNKFIILDIYTNNTYMNDKVYSRKFNGVVDFNQSGLVFKREASVSNDDPEENVRNHLHGHNISLGPLVYYIYKTQLRGLKETKRITPKGIYYKPEGKVYVTTSYEIGNYEFKIYNEKSMLERLFNNRKNQEFPNMSTIFYKKKLCLIISLMTYRKSNKLVRVPFYLLFKEEQCEEIREIKHQNDPNKYSYFEEYDTNLAGLINIKKVVRSFKKWENRSI